ncbi:putative exosortase-associated protein, TIGR04073 family [Nitrosovibrio tenuis]|uniref:Putative exosortase-associated protein, TIGR04073 family n=2 Tax=Nitrosovibrio tenuis TaxID=1233 RepID=A0A1H7MDW1_9PROT|nr:putative exosortase-associated protein, TIGR04073 family [Nitrosovibrio tenuis]
MHRRFKLKKLNLLDAIHINLDSMLVLQWIYLLIYFREVSMKNMLKPLLLVSALLFFSPHAAMAANESYPEKVGNKLAHGVANTVTGIVEVPKNMILESNKKGPAYGIPVGFFTGIVQGIGRTLTGVVDLVTFPIPTKPIIYPDFIWKDFDKETHYHPDWKLQ